MLRTYIVECSLVGIILWIYYQESRRLMDLNRRVVEDDLGAFESIIEDINWDSECLSCIQLLRLLIDSEMSI